MLNKLDTSDERNEDISNYGLVFTVTEGGNNG
jgi:hypothetical protein